VHRRLRAHLQRAAKWHRLVPAIANAAALALTTGANFAANRRFTFRATSEPLTRQLVSYAVAYALGTAASTVALSALTELLGHPARHARHGGRRGQRAAGHGGPLRVDARLGVQSERVGCSRSCFSRAASSGAIV
jgi:hypothetical protein